MDSLFNQYFVQQDWALSEIFLKDNPFVKRKLAGSIVLIRENLQSGRKDTEGLKRILEQIPADFYYQLPVNLEKPKAARKRIAFKKRKRVILFCVYAPDDLDQDVLSDVDEIIALYGKSFSPAI